MLYLTDSCENGLDREASRLSVQSTSASENQTLRLLVENDITEDGQANNSAMDVDIPAEEDSEMSSPLSEVSSDVEASTSVKPTQDNPPIRNIIHTPDGTIIVETLDTPALRRQKSIYRRTERLRLAAEAEVAATAAAGPSELPASGSGSSSLTNLEDREDGEKRDKSRVSAPVPPPPQDPAVVVLGEGEMLEGGTLGMYHKPCHFTISELIRAIRQFGPKPVSCNSCSYLRIYLMISLSSRVISMVACSDI